MNDTPRKSPVTLEDLLRVKRAERPPAEFWSEFERGMRSKQLAAIVEPRPWWAPFIRVGAKVARYQLPVGAAAILAVTFVTLREYRTVEIAPVYEPAVAMVASTRPSADLAKAISSESVSSPIVADVPMIASETSGGTNVAAEIPEAQAPAIAATTLGSSSHVIPVTIEPTPSARYIAENFAAARADHPELDRVLNGSSRNVDLASRVEPLAQVNVPGQSRRARLMGGIASFASTNSNADSTLRIDEQSSSRLTERRLSEAEISRIDVGGSRLTVKF